MGKGGWHSASRLHREAPLWWLWHLRRAYPDSILSVSQKMTALTHAESHNWNLQGTKHKSKHVFRICIRLHSCHKNRIHFLAKLVYSFPVIKHIGDPRSAGGKKPQRKFTIWHKIVTYTSFEYMETFPHVTNSLISIHVCLIFMIVL